ncbi:MAG: hypothetical protein M3008_07185 [Chloroflexota bacterium]|nr:hypothetical protein [Chloroflexota bacterium]
MYAYIELWKVKPAWHSLPQEQRQQFFQTVGEEIGNQLGAGAGLVAVARNDADTSHRADYDFVAVWTIPDREKGDAFAATWLRVGFHDYFAQEDVRGKMLDPASFIGAHLAL